MSIISAESFLANEADSIFIAYVGEHHHNGQRLVAGENIAPTFDDHPYLNGLKFFRLRDACSMLGGLVWMYDTPPPIAYVNLPAGARVIERNNDIKADRVILSGLCDVEELCLRHLRDDPRLIAHVTRADMITEVHLSILRAAIRKTPNITQTMPAEVLHAHADIACVALEWNLLLWARKDPSIIFAYPDIIRSIIKVNPYKISDLPTDFLRAYPDIVRSATFSKKDVAVDLPVEIFRTSPYLIRLAALAISKHPWMAEGAPTIILRSYRDLGQVAIDKAARNPLYSAKEVAQIRSTVTAARM